MAHIKLKSLLKENQTKKLDEMVPVVNPGALEGLINIVNDLGLPAWTALPIGIGLVTVPLAILNDGFKKIKDAIKHKIERRQLTPEDAEQFAIDVETAIKDIPGRQRAYLTQLLNSYKRALAAEAGGLDNITNINGDDAKDIMMHYMKELQRRLPELNDKNDKG
jgi:hypothetical protein